MNQKQTWISTAVQFCIFLNIVLVGLGCPIFVGITEEMWYAVISLIVLGGGYIWSIWKNHNFTKKAADKQVELNIEKGKLDIYDVDQEVECAEDHEQPLVIDDIEEVKE